MSDLAKAKEIFKAGRYTFVVVKNGEVLATGTREGVGELLDVVAQYGERLRGTALADKIVGKAVALIAAFAGVAAVYTPLASRAAQETLMQHGIALEAEQLVPLIQNKRNDGPCPMEKLTLPIQDPAQAVAALREFVRRVSAVTSQV